MRTQICPRCGNVLLDGKHHINKCRQCGWHSEKSFEEFCRRFDYSANARTTIKFHGRQVIKSTK